MTEVSERMRDHFTGLKRWERYKIEVTAVTGQVQSSLTVVVIVDLTYSKAIHG